jgi:hypothetical protein
MRILEGAEERLQSRDLYVWAVLRLTRGKIAARANHGDAPALIRDAFAQFDSMGAAPMRQRAELHLASLGESA